MHAVILSEAGGYFGRGHLSRCIALKKRLERAGFGVTIYNRGSLKNDECINFNWMDENIEHLLENKPLVVLDSYYASFEFIQMLCDKAKICIIFDDFYRMIYPKTAIILNGAFKAERLYNGMSNECFLGIGYYLLRDEFLIREEKIIKNEIVRVLITLGADTSNNTQKAIDIIEKEIPYANLSVVIPDVHRALNCGFGVDIYSNLNARELKDLMLDCDLAISGGGVSMVELQSTRTPTIALEIAPNQSYQMYVWQKVGLRIAKHPSQIKNLLRGMRKLKDRKKIHDNLNKIEIGSHVDSFINEIKIKYLG